MVNSLQQSAIDIIIIIMIMIIIIMIIMIIIMIMIIMIMIIMIIIMIIIMRLLLPGCSAQGGNITSPDPTTRGSTRWRRGSAPPCSGPSW